MDLFIRRRRPVRIFPSSLSIFPSFFFFFSKLSTMPLSKCYSLWHTFIELSRFTGRSSEVRSIRATGTVDEMRRTRGEGESARRDARVGDARSISTTGRRHCESLLQCGRLHRLSRASCMREQDEPNPGIYDGMSMTHDLYMYYLSRLILILLCTSLNSYTCSSSNKYLHIIFNRRES